LGGKGERLPRERYQEPTLEQTKRGAWFIRPWVDVIKDGRLTRAKKTISIGAMGKREAQSKAREIMATINRSDYVVSSQINFGKFLTEYAEMHLKRLSPSTQQKCSNLIKNHIRPTFEKLMLCELQPLLVQRWLDSIKLSWATKTDLRNILSGAFTKAIDWGVWKDANPIERVHVGPKIAVREQRKLTDEEMRRLLAALSEDVRMIVCVGLFCTLRISEILAIQEKHLDFTNGLILVRQSYCRGSLAPTTKTPRSRRDVPMGFLEDDLKRMMMGDPERFVFQIKTRPMWGRETAICRDDRAIRKQFLSPAAKALGIYWKGFGFHSFRREAVTAMSAELGVSQAMRMAGHSTASMSLHYTLADVQKQDAAVRSRQEAILGKTGAKVQ
jgi:integrase